MRVYLFFILFLIQTLVSGQPQSFNPDFPLKDLSVTSWGADEGLSSNNTTSIFQGSDGLLWISSFNGVVTFNGEQFEIFDRNRLPILGTDGFYCALEPSPGTILLGSQGSGLIEYRAGVYKIYKPKQGEIPKSIRILLKTQSGDIFLGTTAGLFRLRQDTVISIDIPKLVGAPVTALIEGADETIWVGTDGVGLFSIHENTIQHFTKKDGLNADNIGSFAFLPNGTLLIGTGKGINEFDSARTHFTSIPALENSQINSMLVGKGSTVWVGTERWLGRYHLENKKLEVLESKNGVDFTRITKIIKDREGNLWLSSNRSGIIRLRETNISNLQMPLVSSNRVNIIHETASGKLYVGTDVNQIDIHENGRWQSVSIKTPIAGNGVRDIFEEGPTSLWLATYSGIINIKDGKEIVYSTANGMPADDFRTILKDRQGNFWFGSRSGGAVKFKDGKILKIYNRNNGLASNYIMSITETNNGDIYVGTNSGGMTKIANDGTTRTYHVRKDDAGILIFNVDQDDEGRIWVMANTGPMYFDKDSLRAIPLSFDPKSKTYFDWIDDQQGTMWITTNNGVVKIDKKILIECIAQNKIVPFQLVNDKDGMNNKECTGATRSTLSRTGKVYIPTLGGVCIIDPKMNKSNFIVPVIRIDKFVTDTLANNPYENDQRIRAGTFRYSFQFSSLSFSAPERNKFRYQLEGFDKNWSDEITKGEVEYTNLPPGDYTFRVIGSNDNNIWNEAGSSLSFRVNPFFYQTFWFFLTLIVLVCTILFALYTWRITLIRKQNEALKKVNTELDRFVYSASHDLRSPLSSIQGLISLARLEKGNDLTEYLNLIDKSVRKLDFFIRDIIDFSRNARLEIISDRIDFETMIKDIMEDVHFLENYSKIKILVDIHTKNEFRNDSRRVRIILSNLISNAVKHHSVNDRVAEVSINIHDSATGVNIIIADNGPGIEEKYQQEIFKMFFRATHRTQGSGLGLYIVQETVEKLKGTVTVSSTVNKGTSFTVTLPSFTRED
jgi:signal transduction histidine kinase/ligand-binding sensor domain-containing protein